MDLRSYFDRVVLINLKRRPDRLARVKLALRQCQWPFKQPEIFEAVDGSAFPPAPGWLNGSGAWGCKASHQAVLARALADGINTLLVMEDDVCFVENFCEEIEKFLSDVPSDWDQLMFGGQHSLVFGKATLVKPGVLKCASCERMHCFGIRRPFMRRFYERLCGGGKYDGNVHCDWILGRDPEMQLTHQVYAPLFFLVGQDGGYSDIYRAPVPRKIWNPPGPELSVINLHAPPAVAAALRFHGFCTGTHLGLPDSGHYAKLCQAFLETANNPGERQQRLHQWITFMQWELAVDPNFVCTVWHPEATPQLVKTASLWRVYEITANCVKAALEQLPPELARLRAIQRDAFAPPVVF